MIDKNIEIIPNVPATATPAPPAPTPLPGSNSKQRRLARLRTTALDEQESPLERIEAARKILQKHGTSERNIPIVRTVIKLYINSLDGNLSYRAIKLKARLAKLLELKAIKLSESVETTEINIAADATDPQAIALEPGMIEPADPWDAPPPLDRAEQLRLVELQRSSLTGRALLDEALNGRAISDDNLKKLFLHMTKSCAAGGCFLAEGGRLYEEIKAVLTLRGEIPASSDPVNNFGRDLLAELNAR
jgi:hypothetical protein